MLLTPALLAAVSWLNPPDDMLLLLAGFALTVIILIAAWCMCGPGPGAGMAALGFFFVLFTGPALDDYVMERRGTAHEALVGDVSTYTRKHGEGRTCSVVWSASGETHKAEVGDRKGCDESVRQGDRTTIVTDPEGWLRPRLGGDGTGLSAGTAWTCAGLLAGMEAFILYGRLRRRRRA
ncbi:hypothetical protein FGW37_01955 [Streptomyces rectiverticillatus]|uniref:hypothetical protein n=1 Tax=Streptomyces rectiverticillatus TaxID=173860 RepID=UPI0015C31982|nr:hypothetical protein [Streptomyces rectiverticillatus]QLE70532.1 hypothetical protein FGW37_01955 [Streptomyces rectiverticillatus]